MSLPLTSIAWKQDLKPSAKLVLLFLASCADDKACCSPSIDAIRKAVGVSAMTIYVALNTLEEADLIEREGQPAAPNLYRLYLTEAMEA